MTTPQHKNRCPGGHESNNFNRPFLGHYYYILSLSDLCLGVEKIFKVVMYFQYMTYNASPQRKNPCPGGHKICNFGRPFLGHHYNILSFSHLCLRVEKIFKEIMYFHYMTYMTTPQRKNSCPGGHEIYNFGRSFFGHQYFTCT